MDDHADHFVKTPGYINATFTGTLAPGAARVLYGFDPFTDANPPAELRELAAELVTAGQIAPTILDGFEDEEGEGFDPNSPSVVALMARRAWARNDEHRRTHPTPNMDAYAMRRAARAADPATRILDEQEDDAAPGCGAWCEELHANPYFAFTIDPDAHTNAAIYKAGPRGVTPIGYIIDEQFQMAAQTINDIVSNVVSGLVEPFADWLKNLDLSIGVDDTPLTDTAHDYIQTVLGRTTPPPVNPNDLPPGLTAAPGSLFGRVKPQATGSARYVIDWPRAPKGTRFTDLST